METILLGVFFFIVIVVALVVVLVAAKSKLVNTDEVSILINEDPENSIRVPAGDTLLERCLHRKSSFPPLAAEREPAVCARSTSTVEAVRFFQLRKAM